MTATLTTRTGPDTPNSPTRYPTTPRSPGRPGRSTRPGGDGPHRRPRVSRPPRLEPPCDDELPFQLDLVTAFRASTPLELSPASFAPSRAVHNRHIVPARIGAHDPTNFDAVPTSRDALPPARRHAHYFAQTIVEVMVGTRGIQQLAPLLSAEVYEDLATAFTRRPRLSAKARTPHILTVQVCEPDDGVAEASIVVRDNGHCYAIAMRMEGLDNAWRCTLFEII